MSSILRYFLRAILALAFLPLLACEDVVGPLTSTRVSLAGPDYAYGRTSGDVFVCEYSVSARASGSSGSSGVVRWSGASVEVFDGNTLLEQKTMSAKEAERIFGYALYPGQTRRSSTFRVTGPLNKFKVVLWLTYYDEKTSYTDEARFMSDCIAK